MPYITNFTRLSQKRKLKYAPVCAGMHQYALGYKFYKFKSNKQAPVWSSMPYVTNFTSLRQISKRQYAPVCSIEQSRL
jgi:hypothetical protein